MYIKIFPRFITYSTMFTVFMKFLTLQTIFKVTKYFGLVWNTKPLYYIRHMSSKLDLIFFGLIKGYKFYIELRGTGYKSRLLSNSKYFGLILRLGYSHLIFIKLLKGFRVSFFNRLTLCFYCNNLWLLNNRLNSIFLQKKINVYKGKGIFWKNSVLKLKKSTKLKF